MPQHRHRVALVTGASSGIGEAVARALVRDGWFVVGMSRRPGVMPSEQYTHLQVDLAHLAELVDRVESQIGGVVAGPHVQRLALVNCAAEPALLGTVEHVEPEAALRAYAVNVVAPMWLMGWLAQRGSRAAPIRIVNVSSGAGVAAYPGLGTYGGTKAALRLTGMVLASELDATEHSTGIPREVSVLSYSPGPVDTPMQALARSSSRETLPIVNVFRRWHAEGALIQPQAPAAEIVRYLESDGHPRFAEWRYGEEARAATSG